MLVDERLHRAEEFFRKLVRFGVVYHEYHVKVVLGEEISDSANCHPQREVFGEPVGAGGDKRKGH